jgi:pilus assembly protein Flp/PilA
MKKLISFFKDEEGATAVEYGIMVAIIAVGIVLSVEGLRDALKDTFDTVAGKMPGN